MPICRSSGSPVYYEVTGSGYPVLMITGMASVLDWFHYNIPVFAEHYRVVAQDLRGANRDGIPAAPGPYSTLDMAGDSLAILDELGIERAHIVALSMGGMVAQQLAIHHPDRVARVSIVANGLARTPEAIKAAALHPEEHQDSEIGRLHAQADISPEGKLATSLAVCFTPGFRDREPEKFDYYLNNIHLRGNRPETLQAQVMAALEHDTLDELGKVGAPVQLLIGELDAINGGCAPEMAAAIPDCDFRILEGMNHGLNLEHSDEYDRIVLEFLAKGVPA